MALGRKTGGRKKGTPNKRSEPLIALCERAAPGFDPVAWMTALAAGTATEVVDGKEVLIDVPLELRVQCAKEVAKYRHPQKRAVEHTAPQASGIPSVMVVPVGGGTLEDWQESFSSVAAQGPDKLQ